VSSLNKEEAPVLARANSKYFGIRAVILVTIFAGTVPFVVAQQPKKTPASPKAQGMTVDEVIKLVQANVAEEFIIDQLKRANKPIELSVDDLIKLRQNNVSDNIQRVMKDPSYQPVYAKDPPPPPPPPPVAEETHKTPDSADETKSGAVKPADPDNPNSPHDPGVYLYAKDGSGNDRMTILDRAAPRYPDCVIGRVLNHVEVNFPGAQAAVRTKDTRPVFYFSFENTGGSSQFTDTSLTQPNQFTLVPMSTGKKGRQVRLTASCVAPTKIAVGFKVERTRPGFYKLTLAEPLAAGDYAFFGSGALPQDVFEFGIDGGSAAIAPETDLAAATREPAGSPTDPRLAAVDLRGRSQRSYWEFKITKSEQPQKVGDVSILLNRADEARQTYTIVLVVDDGMVWKNDRAVNERVRFMAAKSRQPYELIVRRVTNDTIAGYLSASRVPRDSPPAHSDLIATNANELATLRTRTERSYLEFEVTKSKEPQKLGDVSILLKQTNEPGQTYTIVLMVDDGMVWKNDRAANEAVRFATAKSEQPYELVVNRVTNDTIAGYISAPRVPGGDLARHSVLIATNAKELAALRTLGERNYFEFTVTKSKTSQKVNDIQILLKKADLKKHTFTIELTVDDATVEKKDKVMNEPVQFMTSKSKQPCELVVNKVTKDTIAGYLAVPKVLTQRN
jgi:hypothetical protein